MLPPPSCAGALLEEEQLHLAMALSQSLVDQDQEPLRSSPAVGDLLGMAEFHESAGDSRDESDGFQALPSAPMDLQKQESTSLIGDVLPKVSTVPSTTGLEELLDLTFQVQGVAGPPPPAGLSADCLSSQVTEASDQPQLAQTTGCHAFVPLGSEADARMPITSLEGQCAMHPINPAASMTSMTSGVRPLVNASGHSHGHPFCLESSDHFSGVAQPATALGVGDAPSFGMKMTASHDGIAPSPASHIYGSNHGADRAKLSARNRVGHPSDASMPFSSQEGSQHAMLVDLSAVSYPVHEQSNALPLKAAPSQLSASCSSVLNDLQGLDLWGTPTSTSTSGHTTSLLD